MQVRWTIYSKAGSQRCVANALELHDEWMGECYVTVTVESPVPLGFTIDDYIIYRGEKYVIDFDPSIVKSAERNSYGEAFVYSDIKFLHESRSKIARCDFTDLVLSDNQTHYTSLPKFPFFCGSVDDLLDRIQANLETLYPGEFCIIGLNTVRNFSRATCVSSGAATRQDTEYRKYIDPTGAARTDEYGVQNMPITVDNISCWDALAKVNEVFELNFIIRGYTIIVGTNGALTANKFKYGKGKGLYEIEQVAAEGAQVITRLKAYGNETNLPPHYYANYAKSGYAEVTAAQVSGNGVIISTSLRYSSDIFNGKGHYDIVVGWREATIKVGNTTALGRVYGANIDGNTDVYVGSEDNASSTVSAIIASATEGAAIIFNGGISPSHLPVANITAGESSLPNNMAVSRLMLPGFPEQSLADWVSANRPELLNEGFVFSTNPLRPYIDAPTKSTYGIRPGNVYFDGSNETEDVYPTITGMTIGGNAIDEVVEADQITDNGIYTTNTNVPNFKITLPDLGFSLDAVLTSDAAIEMKDGMCGARTFPIVNVRQNEYGYWECTCERCEDSSLHLWFPYNDFQIHADDHYVLTGIELPEAYVTQASERLFDEAIEALRDLQSPKFTWEPRIDELFMARQHEEAENDDTIISLHDSLRSGDIFRFQDTDLGIDEEMPIDVLTIKENDDDKGIPTYEVSLREEKAVTAIQRLTNKVDAIANGSISVNATASGGSGSGGRGGLSEEAAREMFLSKTDDDTAEGHITFNDGLTSNSNVDVNGNTETDTLVVNDYVNGDLDIHGNADVAGDITAGGDVEAEGDINGTNVNATNNVTAGNNISAENTISGKDIKAEESLEIGDYQPSSGGIGGQGGKIWIDGNGYSHAVFDVLNVNQQMHVTELIVDRAKNVGGTLIVSPANMEVGDVEWLSSDIDPTAVTTNENLVAGFKLYFVNEDSEKEITNEWAVGDLAFCRTWNIKEGSTKDYENKYYWRRVTAIGDNYIILSNSAADDLTLNITRIKVDKPEGNPVENGYYEYNNGSYTLSSDTSVNSAKTYYKFLPNKSTWPATGDYISVLGNDTDRTRQNAIVISAYGENAPSEFDYEGINTFSFPEPIFAKYWDPTINKGNGVYGAFIVKIGRGDGNYVRWDGTQLTIVGDFSTTNGTNVQSALSSLNTTVDSLGTQIEAIIGQDDGTFQIWFGNDVPALLNEPAVNWTTDEMMALHNQDIYYSRTLGGRAWRFVYDSENHTGSWVEITDQYVLQALAEATAAKNAVDNLADDGILSAGSEKAQLLISWKDVESTYIQYPPQAMDYLAWLDPDNMNPGSGSDTTTDEGILLARDLYKALWGTGTQGVVDGFIPVVQYLGNWLNGKKEADYEGTPAITGSDLNWPVWSEATWGADIIPTPYYIGSDFANDTVLSMYGQTKAGYRNAWTDYYSALNKLLRLLTAAGKLKTQRAQADATTALQNIEEISQDGILDASEIPSLRREFESAYRERAQMVDLSTNDTDHTIINSALIPDFTAYLTAFKNVADYLNKKGTTSGAAWPEPATIPEYSVNPNGEPPTWIINAKIPLLESDLPLLLRVGQATKFQEDWSNPTEQGDGGVTFRRLWATLSAAQVALANAISELAKEAADLAQDTADDAQDTLSDLGSDTKITPIEKVILKREFLCYWHEMFDTGGVVNKAGNGQGGWLENPFAYISAFDDLGTYLNGDTSWATCTRSGDTINDSILAVYDILDSGLPSAINTNININTDVVAATYRSKWEAFFSERTKLIASLIAHAQATADEAKSIATSGADTDALNALIDAAISRRGERCQMFPANGVTSETTYKIGDLWFNVTGTKTIYSPEANEGTGGYESITLAGETLVCIGTNNMGTANFTKDWQILDHYVNSWIKASADSVTAGVQTSLGTSGGTLNNIFNQLLINKYGASLTSEWVTATAEAITSLQQAGFITQSDADSAFATLFAQKAQNGDVVSRAVVEALVNEDGSSIKIEAIEGIAANDNLFGYSGWLSSNIVQRSGRWYVDAYSPWFLTYSRSTARADIAARFTIPSITTDEPDAKGIYLDLFQEAKYQGAANIAVCHDITESIITDDDNGYFVVSIYVKNDLSRTSNLSLLSNEVAARNNIITLQISNATIIQSIATNIDSTRLGYSDEEGAKKHLIYTSSNPYIQWNVTDAAWHRLFVVFQANSSTSRVEIKTNYGYNYNSTTEIHTYMESGFWFAKPKLEYGTTATKWIIGESSLKRTGIDIGKGKIRLDADTVEVAQDLTIGGNTRIGGFIYNLQKEVTTYHTGVYNPYLFGPIDAVMCEYRGSDKPSAYPTANLLFPECGSSLKLSSDIDRVVYLNLPFYYPYVQHKVTGAALTSEYPSVEDLGDAYSVFESGYSSDMVLPEITTSGTSSTTCKHFLLHQMEFAKDICRKYLGTTVTIENTNNTANGDSNLYIVVFGVKGIIPYNSHSADGWQEWMEYEPWGRKTTLWTFYDYNSSTSQAAEIRWSSRASVMPRESEAKSLIDMMHEVCSPENGLPTQEIVETRRIIAHDTGAAVGVINDRVWMIANLVIDSRSLYKYQTSFGIFAPNDGASMQGYRFPFAIPNNHFARLKLVYEEGYFFWAIEAFGEIK